MSEQRLSRPLLFLVVLAATAVGIFAATPGGASPPNASTGVFVGRRLDSGSCRRHRHDHLVEPFLVVGKRALGGPHAFRVQGLCQSNSAMARRCGGTWTTGRANSPHPPDSVAGTIPVIIASSITKDGNTITGNIVGLGTVTTDPGYGPNPGHPGTGTIDVNSCGE